MATLEADVVVVGGGIAGMIAAVGVAENGHSVIVLEQSAEDRYICNSRLTGGVYHCALRAPDLPPEVLEAAIIRNRGEGVNKDLARAIAHDVLPTIRWLQAKGVRFIRGSNDAWHNFVLAPPSLGRTDAWRGRGGDTLLRGLETHLNSFGSRVERGARARELMLDHDRLVGVRGDGFMVNASIVIIADGGFQSNPQQVHENISPVPSAIAERNAGTGRGDGLIMARAIGAALATGQSGFYGHVVSRDALNVSGLRFYPWLDELAKAGIVVTPNGRRFCEESRGGTYIANQIAALGDPASSTVVWDNAVWEGSARTGFLAPNPHLLKLGATVFRADTLAGLAAQAGLDPAGLVETAKAHNLAAARSRDQFPKKAGPRPLESAPYWAAPAAAGMTYTMGGLAVDGCSRVLSDAGSVIDGLFAIGGSSGGVEGGPKSAYVGGLVKASATGWRAAQQIAGDLAWQPRSHSRRRLAQGI
jgi:fumarate reductase flavoprotein subunit